MGRNSEIERFSSDVAASASLRQELEAAGTEVGAVVAFANAKGYMFSEADARSQALAGELSEEALEGVAGGLDPALYGVSGARLVFFTKVGFRFTLAP